MLDRMDRISESLKRKICIILQSEVDDPRIGEMTITYVEVTRDLRLARVFYTTSGTEEEKKETQKGLRSTCKFIRGRIAHSMSLKYTPKISFREDKAGEKNEVMVELFKRIENEHDHPEDDGEKGEQDG